MFVRSLPGSLVIHGKRPPLPLAEPWEARLTGAFLAGAFLTTFLAALPTIGAAFLGAAAFLMAGLALGAALDLPTNMVGSATRLHETWLICTPGATGASAEALQEMGDSTEHMSRS